MKKLLAIILASLALISAALAGNEDVQALLWQGPHDGISLNFATGVHYVKAPGQAARYDSFQNLFTFTRNSPAASYRLQSGLIGYANENQFIQVSALDNGGVWAPVNGTMSAASLAPDGTLTAFLWTENSTAAAGHRIFENIAIPLGPITQSIYAKPNGRTWIAIRGQVGALSYFNLTGNCTQGTISVTHTNAFCYPIGGGWYRLGVTTTNNATFPVTSLGFDLSTADATPTYNGDGASGAYFWCPQVQQGTSVGACLQTGASPKYDQPRIEYDASGNALGLLAEGSRTNVQLQSEDLTTTWTATNASVSANQIAAPDGATTADKIIEDATASTNHYVSQGVAKAASAIQYTASTFFKDGNKGFAHIRIANGALTNGAGIGVTLSTCVAGSAYTFGASPFTGASGSATTYANGWCRVTITATSEAVSTTLATQLMLATGTNVGDVTFSGGGTAFIYSWGEMLETPVAFASSYIPTGAASATRAADAITRTPGAEFNIAAGTLFVSGTSGPIRDASSGSFWWEVDDATSNNRIFFDRFDDFSAFGIVTGGVNQAIPGTAAGTVPNSTALKVAASWDATNTAIIANGSGAVTTSGAYSLPVVTTMRLGAQTGAAPNDVGWILKFDLYPKKQPADVLQFKTLPGKMSALTPANDNERRAYG